MIGRYQLQLGAEQLISGMSSSDYATDGALGTSSDQLNPFVTPGIIRAMASASNRSTNLSADLVASSEDSQVVGGVNRVLVDTGGAIYSSASNGALTKQISAGSDSYSFGVTDMVAFAGNNYISSTTHLVQVNTSGWTRTEAFKVFNDSSALHPLLVYTGTGLLYFGDGNLLKKMDSTGTVTTVLTLLTSEKIVALGIDPLTGLMLVSTQASYNPTDSFQLRGIVYMYDGVSAEFSRKILVEDMVCAFYIVGGTVYVGMGLSLGIWTGSGVTFLRKLSNAQVNLQSDLPYKHHFANVRNILCVVDGTKVLTYGDVVTGKKGFFYSAAQNNGNSTLGMICNIGNNQLGVGSTSLNFFVYSFTSTSGGGAALYFNNIYFPRPVFIHRIRVITTGITQTSGIGGCTFFDEKTNQYNTAQVLFVVPASASPKYVFDFDYGGTKVQAIQPRINIDTQGFGVVRVYVYYDIAE